MGILCQYNKCQEESGKATGSYLNGFSEVFFFIEATQNANTSDGGVRLSVNLGGMCRHGHNKV